MTTDTTERGLERLLCTAVTGHPERHGTAEPHSDPKPSHRTTGRLGGALSMYDLGPRGRAALGRDRAVFHRPQPRPMTDRAAVRSGADLLRPAGISEGSDG
jgi:hypothetical protein